ncbi:DUF2513 domain-containing protein [Methylococcus capsulatus]|uniref:DUF2513 domain-containing protein n=1 Tax=Methylococcus capsulatus (strain ATCC 33009 / NCIMB 11132 / Bath) TaxID=243233 RepID=Q602Z1_METCA|nr:DUF2513 domain-containing protein [Methylococcus capsulatus]AAU91003.1 conserved hypothetical protein [Methylococcus capsulatus str. Bath]QXP93050.1 DUF2513 domain-containing protein [Methylococcus capsulatus]
MRLDWNLARSVLEAAEALGDEKDRVAPGAFPGVAEEVAIEHFRLLCEAGLADGYPQGRSPLFLTRLTWSGHQFLATLRSRTLWSRVKAEAKDRGLALSFEVIKALAAKLVGQLVD